MNNDIDIDMNNNSNEINNYKEVEPIKELSNQSVNKEKDTQFNPKEYFRNKNNTEAEIRKEQNNSIAKTIANNKKKSLNIQERIQYLQNRIQEEEKQINNYYLRLQSLPNGPQRHADLAIQWHNQPQHIIDIAIVMSKGEDMDTTLRKKYDEKYRLYQKENLQNCKIVPLIFTSQGVLEKQTEEYLKGLFNLNDQQEKRIWLNYKLKIMATIIQYTTANIKSWLKYQDIYEQNRPTDLLDISQDDTIMVTSDENARGQMNNLTLSA